MQRQALRRSVRRDRHSSALLPAARLWLALLTATLSCLLLGSCNLLKEEPLSPAEQVGIQLKKLQVAIEAGIGAGGTAKVAVLGVVDGSLIDKTASPDDAAAAKKADKKDAPDPAAPLQRERKVRDALSASLVQNRLLELLQPDEASLAAARADMLAANSAALSLAKCRELGVQLGADYIAGSIIDEEGRSVSVAVQRVGDGVVVYQDVLKDWPAIVGEPEAPAEAEKK